MPSSLLSPYLPSSTIPHSFSQSPALYCFSNSSSKIQNGKLVLFSTLAVSARISSETTPPKTIISVAGLIDTYGINLVEKNDGSPIKEEEEDEQEDPNFDKTNSRLQIQICVDRIRALPTSQKAQILHIFQKDGEFHKLSDFNDLLMALVIADEPEVALQLFNNLSSYNLAPDSWTLSIVIRCCCKKNDPTEANQVLDYMLENGFNPNVATFTAVINSFCKKGRLQKAFDVLDIMGGIGLKPTVQTYNCLMKGLCYVGRIEEAYELLMSIKKCCNKLDIYSYTAVMDGFCKVGRTDEAMELLNEALEIGLTPNVVTYNALFNGYCKEGRPLEGINLLKQMKDRNCMPDYISYSTLLHGLLKWGKIRAATQVYKEMVRFGLKVDERMINTLLRGLCRKSWKEEELLKDACQVFDKMKNGYSVIYPCAYGLAIQTLCIGKETNKALVNLHDMIRIGYSPRMITFNCIIRALCDEGKVDEALLVLVLSFERGKIPSRISYNLLIDEFNRQDRLFAACNVYGAALKLGVVPNTKPRKCSTQ